MYYLSLFCNSNISVKYLRWLLLGILAGVEDKKRGSGKILELEGFHVRMNKREDTDIGT